MAGAAHFKIELFVIGGDWGGLMLDCDDPWRSQALLMLPLCI